jgi:hypothetical protein
VCIDIEGATAVWNATLQLRGDRLDVVGARGRTLARIDIRTHEAIPPPAERAAAKDSGPSWLLIAAPTAALLLLLAAASSRLAASKRAAAEPMTEEWEASSDRHAPIA